MRLGLSRKLGQLAGLSLATPALLAAIELLFQPWAHDTWLAIWRASLLGGVFASLALALAGSVTAAIRTSRAGALQLLGEEVVMATDQGTERVALASIVAGVVVPQARGARVELTLTSGDRWFAEVESITAGERALMALGLDASKRRCTIPLLPRASGVLRRVGAITLAIFASLLGLGVALDGGPMTRMSATVWLLATTLTIGAAVWGTKQREITVGADGVALRQRWGVRFLPFSEIQSVTTEGRKVLFALADGRRESVAVARSSGAETAATIAHRIDEAIRARSDGAGSERALAQVARAGRSVAEWQQAIAQLVRQTTGYRAAALSRDDLAALLTHPTASGEQRMGAALALAAMGDDQHKQRIRIAADACASEPMRVALGRLAEGHVDEAAVEEALAAEEGASTTEKARAK